MITEDYVNFETAKLLKEKGFVLDTTKDYWKIDSKGTMYFMSAIGVYTSDSNDGHTFYRPANSYPCPTLQMAMKWLREGYWLNIYALYDSNIWSCIISSMDNRYIIKDNRFLEISGFKSYKDAIDVALKYCLTNLI